MKIAIRADGGSEIGMGHIMRTLVLAKELAKTNEVFYVCRIDNPLSDKYKIGIEKVKSEGFNVKLIDEKNIISDLKNIIADCLITDSYDVDSTYFDETKKIFKKTGYIDDMNLFYFNVDFVLNQNINAVDLEYKCNEDTKLFLGSRYIMLRDEFRNSNSININKKVKDILVTVGGADPNDLTLKLIRFLEELPYSFHVIIGPSFKSLTDFKKIEGNNNNIQFYYNVNMKEIMTLCDIAISACGSTLYELSVMGIPTIGIVIADNQFGIGKKMNEEGLINCIGWHLELEESKLKEAINLLADNHILRKDMSEKQQIKINKKGVSLITNEINKLLKVMN